MHSFNQNDIVLYGSNGVCRIAAIEYREDGAYYILVPVHQDRTKLMVPIDNEALVARMRSVPSREDATHYIHEAAHQQIDWIPDTAERKERAHEILHEGNEIDLLLLIRMLYQHKKKLSASGKKTSSSDNSILRSAEKRMRDEFSVVFDIAPEEVDEFIERYN